jgi:cell division protein FtsB
MTHEDIERAIEFLLQHQASSEARQETIQIQIGELVAQMAAMSREMDIRDQKLSAKIEKMSERIDKVGDEIDGLRDACRDLLDHGHRTDLRLSRLEDPGR